MDKPAHQGLTSPQQAMLDLWQQHTVAEFVTGDVEEALATMTGDAHVLLVPVLASGFGKDEVRAFYEHSVSQVPPDFEVTTISQTIGQDRLVGVRGDEIHSLHRRGLGAAGHPAQRQADRSCEPEPRRSTPEQRKDVKK